ncbi:hypothetical protein [Streptomyces sp. NPDC085529]|uniref:hypothetical protein n=1 Tax=Streptomyces sp. NPDC085529 TaxID=3365729 RepID=UPI0037D7F284
MTRISKGESGPVPPDLPYVGKSSGTGAGTDTGSGTGTGTGSAAGGARAEEAARPPRRVEAADAGRWADLIVPPPAPSPAVAAAAGLLGGEFDTLVYTGRGVARFAMEEKPPPGYVLVEFARTGTGFFDLDSVDWDGREAVGLGDSATSERFERRVMWCDDLYPLRFRVGCGERDDWVIVIRPVSAVRELGAGATGRGSEVLLHTGPAGELASRLDAAGRGRLRVEGHKPHRPGAPAAYPAVLASASERPCRDARPLPEGPLLVAVTEAAGDWSLEVREPSPAEEKKPGLWSRLFGR